MKLLTFRNNFVYLYQDMENTDSQKIKISIPEEKVTNPTNTMVGHVLKEGKETVKSNIEKRVGKVNGKLDVIYTDERVIKYKDAAKFVKFYTEVGALEAFCELSSGAQRLLTVIINRLGYNEDYFYYTPVTMSKQANIAEAALSTYMRELLKEEWIYKSTENKKYWINLVYICVGDRAQMYARYKATQVI